MTIRASVNMPAQTRKSPEKDRTDLPPPSGVSRAAASDAPNTATGQARNSQFAVSE